MLVIPVYDTLILSNIQINVQEEVFSEQEIENIKEEDEFIIVPIKTQKSRSTLAAEDFYDVGILATASTFTNNEGTQLFAVIQKNVLRSRHLLFQKAEWMPVMRCFRIYLISVRKKKKIILMHLNIMRKK